METTQCDVCQSDTYELFIHNPTNYENYGQTYVNFDYMRCLKCYSLFSSKKISEIDLGDLYPNDYLEADKVFNFSDIMTDLFYDLKSLIIYLKYRERKTLRILDFGCGDAKFIKALAKYSKFQVVGFDPFIEREYKNNILFVNELKKLKAQSEFDLVIVNHVLEHVVDVRETLKFIFSLTSNNGKVVGVTPNPSHWLLNFSKKRWGYLHYPQHLRIMSKKGLKIVVEEIDNHKKKIELRIKNNLISTCWAYTAEHFYKDFITMRYKGHWRYDKLVILSFFPVNLIEKLLTRNLSSFTFEIKLNA